MHLHRALIAPGRWLAERCGDVRSAMAVGAHRVSRSSNAGVAVSWDQWFGIFAAVLRGSSGQDRLRPRSAERGPGRRMMTLYERVGGSSFFEALVARFYDGVAGDPVLRPLYPADLRGPAERLAGFLVQYCGGPTTYSELRGHPRLRLRMRHAPFTIGVTERDAWRRHMWAAIEMAGWAVRPAAQMTAPNYE